MNAIRAGAASVDITPVDSQFLYGYPHVRRYSTGVHDPLCASALYLADGDTDLLFVANDIIFVDKALVQRARQRIAERTGVAGERTMITATHTHSGPITALYVSNEADPVVPRPDPKYMQQLEDGIVEAAVHAVAAARPAEIGLCCADATGVGTNRRDPAGPADPEVPVLVARALDTHETIAAMFVCSMHPTVLHEDSTLISGDFPALARRVLQRDVLGDCPVLCHTGPSGNQSPRHVVRGNTFDEAERLGAILAQAIAQRLEQISYRNDITLRCASRGVRLPMRTLDAPEVAQMQLDRAKARLEHLRTSEAPCTEVRTAECDWFGAEETLVLARAATSGRLAAAAEACLPAEVQVFHVGPWCFVEFALRVKARRPNTYVISLANGELQGYLVTAEAVAEGGYEASNALFASPASGDLFVQTTLELLGDQ